MSLIILAISTATEICSIALMINHVILDNTVVTSHKHAKKILMMIDNLLIDSGISLSNIDVLVYSHGPGSFVGLRIGIGVAQGLALGANLPLIGVSTLETLAQGAWREVGARDVLVSLNAYMNAFYFSYYRRQNNGKWLGHDTERIVSSVELADFFIKLVKRFYILVGNGWQKNLMLFNKNDFCMYVNRVLHPLACDMIPLALQKWYDGSIIAPDQVKPIYLIDKLV
ncbi:tRNA (adenosine(37)-N6)-threonylcarbamoyltransferase complex dimerization subunit type 1 TsaB [Blochmannia endosymbiont of Colobopsis nipponica]|uniref:tRNA (adenosine(37)-N6)-threonylcarbamoyltransferase complex dimerization subunit type 1 TsaB n=1 Tax=Blochmannia endosymbiont of Colobopsis nipponica TaxID=2681987 RepID=UPI0017873DC7|nr:tRNA (adenosine(37)-N6)-threonylcarbamoyltransferase complex dimerization subunit type 1 TsaB [Blochmannia endosymbiont of Colobopsis nipponica]QOI11016.1 tRNA (adenosine(37)-N6)-threonylcarbamoyltransferase complex dimerization subunit type 1 TsaB [Blochmannia endosymbiont of Colobopsis nipponica]